MMQGMVIDMEEARLQTIAQVRAFLDGATEIAFRVPKVERYSFVERVLMRFGYDAAGRVGKGVLLWYLALLTGLPRQQETRLVRRYRQECTLSTRPDPLQQGFRRRFTATVVALLADMDARHGTVSGPATKTLRKRAGQLFGNARFERLAAFRCPISTTFGAGPHPSARDGSGPKRDPPASLSASAERPSRMECQGISGSTACIRATKAG